MKYSLLIIIISALVCVEIGCASPLHGGDEGEQTISNEYFDINRQCIIAWSEIVDEWKKNGGGIKNSIAETRSQIKEDGTSRFSYLVRFVWDSQGKIEDVGRVWRWPISDREQRKVFDKFVFPADKRMPAEVCQSFSWVQAMLWDEVRTLDKYGKVTARKLRETPRAMRWQSPWVQQWLEYWIFVRIN